MAAKVTNRLWEVGDIVDVLKAWKGKRPLNPCPAKAYTPARRSEDASMKLALIALGLLATTGAVYAVTAYAACPLCPW
jgi:hypothetical protein